MSSARERIEDDSNSHLFSLIHVIYGAVFSYSMYVFSKIIIDGCEEKKQIINVVQFFGSKFPKQIVFFIAFTVYMIEDVGSIIKMGSLFPFKRTSRYTYEIVIGLMYVCTYTMLGSDNYFCVFYFSLVVILGGLWDNQLKQEYLNHKTNIDKYSAISRDLNYLGAGLLLTLFSTIITFEPFITWLTTLTFTGVLFLWMFVTAKWLCLRCGEKVMKCRLMLFLPDHYVRKICRKSKTIHL